jgi:hypothetical protein
MTLTNSSEVSVQQVKHRFIFMHRSDLSVLLGLHSLSLGLLHALQYTGAIIFANADPLKFMILLHLTHLTAHISVSDKLHWFLPTFSSEATDGIPPFLIED